MQDTDLCEPVRLTKHVATLRREEVVAYLHSLSFEVFFLDTEFASWIEQFRSAREPLQMVANLPEAKRSIGMALIEQLRNAGLLVRPDYDEDARLRAFVQQRTQKPQIKVLYLLLTDICNLRCTYCFIERPMPTSYQHSVMSCNIARTGLDLFCSLQADGSEGGEPMIVIYGGEPLLNDDCFRYVVRYARRCIDAKLLPDRTRLSLITNGTRLTPDLVSFIRDNDVSVSVSLDGFEDLHNSTRVYHDGRGTFADALGALRRLQSAGLSPSVSCTIGSHNIEHLVDINRWFVDELGVRNIGYNLPLYTPESGDVDGVARDASTKLLECFAYNRQHGVHEDRIMRKVRAFVDRRIRVNDCAACGNQLVVAPNGDLGVCHAYLGSRKYFFGNVGDYQSFIPELQPVIAEWGRRSPLNMEECKACSALGICGGGCPYSADMLTGSIWGVDRRFCTHSLQSLEWLVWDLFGRSQG